MDVHRLLRAIRLLARVGFLQQVVADAMACAAQENPA
jgi:hypothetical protein